jgi:hypothetical protein
LGFAVTCADANAETGYLPYRSVANAPSIKGKATGFFHLEQKDDNRWWIIDPEGQGYVSFGIDHCNYRGHFCYKLGYYIYRKNNDQQYKTPAEKAQKFDAAADRLARDAEAGPNPPDYAVRWGDDTEKRLREWGFNAMGSTCDEQFSKRGFVTRPLLRMSESFAKQGSDYCIAEHKQRASTVFPNVFHPEFADFCEKFAEERCTRFKDNPWYLGYYIDNELAWWGRSNRTLPVGLFNLTMGKEPTHTAKIALRDFLKKESDNDIAKFNAFWGTSLNSFDEILNLKKLPESTKEQIAAKDRFLGLIAEIYFSTTSRAIRKADPNHLILGCRFADINGAGSPSVWRALGKYCDAVSINFYPSAQLDENCVYPGVDFKGETMDEAFQRLYSYTNKPMLVTEWSFPALDSGLPCTWGAGQRFNTQTERTRATNLFARTMLSEKSVVGYDYFMWCDEPALGLTPQFLENSNYGLVNEKGEAYKEITEMFTELHKHPEKYRLAPMPKRRKLPVLSFPNAQTVAMRLAGSNRADKSQFQKSGETYTISNSKIKLQGKLGSESAFDSITLSGGQGEVGPFELLLQERDNVGVSFWRKPRKIAAVTGRNLPDGSAEAVITALGWRYLLVVRIVLPANSEQFVSELVSVKNISPTALDVVAIFFRLTGTDAYAIGERLPPRLWKAPQWGYWNRADTGFFMGSVAPNGSECRVYFHRSGKKRNADARLVFPTVVTLSQNQIYQPQSTQTGIILHIFGKGGKAEFMSEASKVEKLMR